MEEQEKNKKIIVFGVVSPQITLRINEMSEKHGALVEYRDAEEGREPYAIAEGFDPNPPKTTIPFTVAPYPSLGDDLSPYMFKDFELSSCGNNGKQSKYARPATQAELDAPKIGRNELCHCGSGQKFKKCHGK